jgi:ABC-type antimicrobial peptide transport system permease subunit
MNLSRSIVAQSIRYHLRTNLAVAAGVAAATAVIVGALLVGDSMRGSLRDMTLERLGKFDQVLVSDRFFRVDLAQELSGTDGFGQRFSTALPVIYFPAGTAEHPDLTGLAATRSSGIQILGITPDFWKQSRATDTIRNDVISHLADNQVILNAPLAADLNVKTGDRITLRLPAGDKIPADSTLAQKGDRVRSLAELEVVLILPATGLARFSLRANQALPMTAFVTLAALQEQLEETDKCNSLFIAGVDDVPAADGQPWLNEHVRLSPIDLGLHIRRHRLQYPAPAAAGTENPGTDQEGGPAVFDYYSITSDRMVLEDAVAASVQSVADRWSGQAATTYLADSISVTTANVDADRLTKGIPYSMVTGVDNTKDLSYLPESETLGPDEIVINSDTADRLGVRVGESITIHYLEPESSHGEATVSRHDFTIRAIMPLTKPSSPFDSMGKRVFDQPPTRFNDPSLTPEVEGITDQESIDNWEAPFPGYDDRRITDVDELYWDEHRTTPRAFVSLDVGRKLWGSRFGSVTSVMIPAAATTAKEIDDRLTEDFQLKQIPAQIGLNFRAVKQESLAASAGTTPFDGLFLGLSFFIIFAAIALVSILFRLGIEQRYQDIGLLSALGITRPAVLGLFLREGLVVATIGSLFGVPLGLAYGAAMINGLQTWWVDAIGSQFLRTHITWISPTLGLIIGLIVSAIVIFLSIRSLKHRTVHSLLAGQTSSIVAPVKTGKWLPIVAISCLIIGVLVGFAGTRLAGELQAIAFVGSGGMLLTALTCLAWYWLRQPGGNALTLTGLAISNAKRNTTRSGMTIGLVATASFLILAMSAFRLAPSDQGSGGFRWLGRSATPIYGDLAAAAVRREVLGSAALPGDALVYSMRLKPGDDASCRNLYQSTQPQVYGVTQPFIERYDDKQKVAFGWAQHAAIPSGEPDNPWRLLLNESDDSAIPIVVDNNTAMYSLHWYGGVGAEYELTYDDGQTINVRVVGLLANSVLQGALLMSESNFKETFPTVSGYRLFLVDASEDEAQDNGGLVAYLENGLSDQGFDLTSTVQLLDDLLAVQNTYLSAFQSLGALGLIFGVFGLGAVQLRNVFERRKELALMRAEGFSPRRLGRLVFTEMFMLLSCGLIVGIVSALASVLPHMLASGVQPPLWTLSFWLLVILGSGMASGTIAVVRTINSPVVAALRGE